MTRQLTAIIEREGNGYASLCRNWISQAKAKPSNRHEKICAKPWSYFLSVHPRKR